MPILIKDTQTNAMIDLGKKTHIKMYVCGPTVYDSSHLGHARNYIVYDTMRRILEDYFNIPVFYVNNITDMDDKIIKRAQEEFGSGTLSNCKLISEKFETKFWESMELLNVRKPTVITRVTEYIQEMVDYIQQIESNGFAYRDEDGSIYFDSKKFSLTGKSTNPFNQNNSEDLDKDFCLWKGKKEFDQSFYSTKIGDGRPGWHLECSTMINKVLGETIDIHGGGIDLLGIHHTNEHLQAHAHSPQLATFSHAFAHCGHLSIKGLKMAKTLKNFITIEEYLVDHSPNVIRLYFLSYDYEASLELSELEVHRVTHLNDKFIAFESILTLCQTYSDNSNFGPSELELMSNYLSFVNQINLELSNNFNTKGVIRLIENLIDLVNNYISTNSISVNKLIVAKLHTYVKKIFGILGLQYVKEVDNSVVVNEIVRLRDELKTILIEEKDLEKTIKQKLFKITDSLRDQILPKLGVKLNDLK